MKDGTVTPTHYNVIHDTVRLSPDTVQCLTYRLCHMYYNLPVSIFWYPFSFRSVKLGKIECPFWTLNSYLWKCRERRYEVKKPCCCRSPLNWRVSSACLLRVTTPISWLTSWARVFTKCHISLCQTGSFTFDLQKKAWWDMGDHNYVFTLSSCGSCPSQWFSSSFLTEHGDDSKWYMPLSIPPLTWRETSFFQTGELTVRILFCMLPFQCVNNDFMSKHAQILCIPRNATLLTVKVMH